MACGTPEATDRNLVSKELARWGVVAKKPESWRNSGKLQRRTLKNPSKLFSG